MEFAEDQFLHGKEVDLTNQKDVVATLNGLFQELHTAWMKGKNLKEVMTPKVLEVTSQFRGKDPNVFTDTFTTEVMPARIKTRLSLVETEPDDIIESALWHFLQEAMQIIANAMRAAGPNEKVVQEHYNGIISLGPAARIALAMICMAS